MAAADALPPQHPLTIMAHRARIPSESQRPALLWLPSPSSWSSSSSAAMTSMDAPDTYTDQVSLSYAALWACATAAACHLRKVIAPLNSGYPPPPALSALLSPEHRAYTVGVMVDEGPGLAVAELAVMISGAAVVPLGTGDPPARLRSMLQDVECIAAIAAPSENPEAFARLKTAAHGLRSYPIVIVDVFDLLNSAGCSGDDGFASKKYCPGGASQFDEDAHWCLNPSPHKLSHVFFTSGSTGRPKGCLATHGALAHYCRAKNEAHGITAESVVLVASPHTFDPSIGDLFASWAVGACVALAPRADLFTSLDVCMAASSTTHVLTTPSMLGTIQLPPPHFPALRVVALGGERMPESLASAWLPRVEVLANTYGVTECCVYQTFHRIGGSKYNVLEAGKNDSKMVKDRCCIGQPLRDCELLLAQEPGSDPSHLLPDWHLADDSIELTTALPLPGTTELAELWISGPQVGPGYANLPGLTAEKFRTSLTGVPGEFCFRTGDIVRRAWKAGGECTVELVGRRDDQIKLNGQRIELGEIEAALSSCELVSAVACTHTVTDSRVDKVYDGGHADEKVLIAHVLLEPNESCIDSAVQTALELHAAMTLPTHMVPGRYVAVQGGTLPLTMSGKIDRSELERRMIARGECDIFSASRQDFEPLENDLERAVAQAWAEALGLASKKMESKEGIAIQHTYIISAADHFGALGGNSLSALRACRALLAYTNVANVPDGDNSINNTIGLHTGEAAALISSEFLPRDGRACAFGVVDGPLAPCQLLTRPVLREYAKYLASSGVFTLSALEDEGGESLSSTGMRRETEERGSMALVEACSAGRVSLARSLLRAGVSPNGITYRKDRGETFTPLHLAASSGVAGTDSLVHALLLAGADPMIVTVAGTYPSHLAAARGDAGSLTILLAAGCPPGAADADKQTILHLASRSGNVAATEVAALACGPLSTRSGGLEAWDRWKRTAAAWALHSGNAEILTVLREAGCRMDVISMNVAQSVRASKGATTLRPQRKRPQGTAAIEALVSHLSDPPKESKIAASALRDVVCANAENRDAARIAGAFPRLVALIKAALPFLEEGDTCSGSGRDTIEAAVHAAGTLRNLGYANSINRSAAAQVGALECLAETLRRTKSTSETNKLEPVTAEDGYDAGNTSDDGQKRQLAFVSASALLNLAHNDEANKNRIRALGVDHLVKRLLDREL